MCVVHYAKCGAKKKQSAEVRLALRRDPVAGHTEAQQLPQQEHHEKVSNFKKCNTMKALTLFRSKPQTLFQKTSTRSFEAAKGQPMFADIPKKSD